MIDLLETHWEKIRYFKPSEFADDCELVDPELFYRLDFLREQYGASIYPSPVKGALARIGGSKTSQHFVGHNVDTITRQSTGVDVFPTGLPIRFYTNALRIGGINGIGMYLDTTGIDGKPWVMFHFDIRKLGFKIGVPLIWIAEKVICPETHKLKTKYRYPQLQPEYWSLLKDERLYIDRQKG